MSLPRVLTPAEVDTLAARRIGDQGGTLALHPVEQEAPIATVREAWRERDEARAKIGKLNGFIQSLSQDDQDEATGFVRDMEEVEAMSDEEVAAELRAAGHDPEDFQRRGTAIVKTCMERNALEAACERKDGLLERAIEDTGQRRAQWALAAREEVGKR